MIAESITELFLKQSQQSQQSQRSYENQALLVKDQLHNFIWMIHSLPWLCKRHIKVEFFCSFCDSVHDWESKQPGWLETMKVLTHITDEVQNDFPGQSQLSLLFLVPSLRMIDPFGTRSLKEVSISCRLLQKIFSTVETCSTDTHLIGKLKQRKNRTKTKLIAV